MKQKIPLSLQQALIKALIYSDIFDYPLTLQELYLYLPHYSLPSCESLQQFNLKQIPEIDSQKGFYFLRGREKLVALRHKRNQESQKKLQLASRLIRPLKLIPWIWLIGVSGTVAANNAAASDDIDLFLITAPGRLWLTRMGEKIINELLGQRRRPNFPPSDPNSCNKLCPNMYLAADNLTLPHRDLYTARELAQLKIIFQRHQTHRHLYQANSWIKKFLPNWWQEKKKTNFPSLLQPLPSFNNPFFSLLERLAAWGQLYYMARRRTREKISSSLLMFHPQDARKRILTLYQKRLQEYGISL